jgi:hypothetical protein
MNLTVWNMNSKVTDRDLFLTKENNERQHIQFKKEDKTVKK